MEKNEIIILALIVVIIALLVGLAAMMMPNFTKQDTQLIFKSSSALNEGDSLKVMLTDVDGSTLAGQTVNVTIINKDNSKDYHSVETNENGIGKLKLDKDAGNYTVIISYGGNDKYNGCNATKKISIGEKVEESSSSNAPSAYAYKSDGTPMYSQSEVDNYMLNKYGMVDYHVGSNGYIDMDEPGFDDAGNWVGY